MNSSSNSLEYSFFSVWFLCVDFAWNYSCAVNSSQSKFQPVCESIGDSKFTDPNDSSDVLDLSAGLDDESLADDLQLLRTLFIRCCLNLLFFNNWFAIIMQKTVVDFTSTLVMMTLQLVMMTLRRLHPSRLHQVEQSISVSFQFLFLIVTILSFKTRHSCRFCSSWKGRLLREFVRGRCFFLSGAGGCRRQIRSRRGNWFPRKFKTIPGVHSWVSYPRTIDNRGRRSESSASSLAVVAQSPAVADARCRWLLSNCGRPSDKPVRRFSSWDDSSVPPKSDRKWSIALETVDWRCVVGRIRCAHSAEGHLVWSHSHPSLGRCICSKYHHLRAESPRPPASQNYPHSIPTAARFQWKHWQDCLAELHFQNVLETRR